MQPACFRPPSPPSTAFAAQPPRLGGFVPRLPLGMAVLCCGVLTACQTTPKAPPLASTVPVQHTITSQFSLTGKIGVRTPQQNGSAFYAWSQVNDYFAIDLSGAMGIGQTRIEGTPGQVTLTSAKTGTLTAASPEELLQKATGWQAPISYLRYWVQGKTATSNAQATLDQLKRISQLQEGNWQVHLSYDGSQPLPQKLVMVHVSADPLASSNEQRVTLTIQTRSGTVP